MVAGYNKEEYSITGFSPGGAFLCIGNPFRISYTAKVSAHFIFKTIEEGSYENESDPKAIKCLFDETA